jgi:hypothetical protein
VRIKVIEKRFRTSIERNATDSDRYYLLQTNDALFASLVTAVLSSANNQSMESTVTDL